MQININFVQTNRFYLTFIIELTQSVKDSVSSNLS